MDIKQLLSSKLAIDFQYHESYKGSDDKPIFCQACHEVISSVPSYTYENRFYNGVTGALHKTCAESPHQIQHPLHPDHPLEADSISLAYFGATKVGYICKGCRYYSFGFSYNCRTSQFKLDFQCASNLQIKPPEGKMEIEADFHYHKLQRFYSNTGNFKGFRDIYCSYCSKGFKGSAFACVKCNLFIHEPCIHKVPYSKQITTPFHSQHPLLLEIAEDAMLWCHACTVVLNRGDLFLSCRDCPNPDCFHISCGSVTTSGLRLKQYHVDHPMFYLYWVRGITSRLRKCVVCNTMCENTHVYGCLDCNVFVHLECIPLPRVVKHQSHSYGEHELILSDSTNLVDFSSDEYHCVICEKQGNLNHMFYYCEECSDLAHIDCVLSDEDPPLEKLEYLIPRPVEKFDLYWIEDSADGEEFEELEKESDEQEVDLEDYSIDVIDERIVAIREKMGELTSQLKKLAIQLEFHQEVRHKKLQSSILPQLIE